jgi:hypothetical protein
LPGADRGRGSGDGAFTAALTGGEQHPNMLRPQSIRDFPLLAVAG